MKKNKKNDVFKDAIFTDDGYVLPKDYPGEDEIQFRSKSNPLKIMPGITCSIEEGYGKDVIRYNPRLDSLKIHDNLRIIVGDEVIDCKVDSISTRETDREKFIYYNLKCPDDWSITISHNEDKKIED